MRTRQQEQYRYNALTPRAFAERAGLSEERVRRLIHDGWFRWTRDPDEPKETPECLDVRRVDAKKPVYRIKKSAVDRWFRDRAVTSREVEPGEESGPVGAK